MTAAMFARRNTKRLPSAVAELKHQVGERDRLVRDGFSRLKQRITLTTFGVKNHDKEPTQAHIG
jgi:hypothetical protein